MRRGDDRMHCHIDGVNRECFDDLFVEPDTDPVTQPADGRSNQRPIVETLPAAEPLPAAAESKRRDDNHSVGREVRREFVARRRFPDTLLVFAPFCLIGRTNEAQVTPGGVAARREHRPPLASAFRPQPRHVNFRRQRTI